MIRITLYVVLGISLMFLVSCSASKDDGSIISRPFSSVDANREIVLAPNHTFEIVLPSNPTTGYEWTLEIDKTNIVRNIAHKFVADSSGRVGVGGNTIWTLRTGRTGNALLTFKYCRSWEKDTPPTRVETFTMSVR
jgi:predicted secreted protein